MGESIVESASVCACVRVCVCKSKGNWQGAYRFGSGFAFALISFEHFHYASACGMAGRRRVAASGVWHVAGSNNNYRKSCMFVCVCVFLNKNNLYVSFTLH